MKVRRIVPLAVLALAACMPKVEQPEVRLAGVRLASIGLNGGVVDVRLSVYNPNRFELRADGLRYELQLRRDGEWVDFTDGLYRETVEVPAGDTAEVSIPVEFSFRGLGDIARTLMDRGAVDYRVSGIVGLEDPIERDIPFRHEGTVTPSGVRD